MKKILSILVCVCVLLSAMVITASAYTVTYTKIDTVEDLISRTEDEMIRVRNLGKKSLEEVIAKLHSLGLELKKEED